MNKTKFIIVLITTIITCCTSKSNLTIVTNGNSNYSISVANNLGAEVENATKELQYYIKKISKVKLPIVTDEEKIIDQPKILIKIEGLNPNEISIRLR